MMPMPTTSSKQQLADFFAARAAQADAWRAKNSYYYQWLGRLLRFILPPGGQVVDVGSGLGDLLSAVAPTRGVGLDFSPAMTAISARRHPGDHLRFVTADIDREVGSRETFDAVIVSDLLGYLDDIQTALEHIRLLCHEHSRVVVTQYNRLWEPILRLGAALGLNQPKPLHNWLSAREVVQLLELAGFEVVSRGHTFLCPKRWWGFGEFINQTVARLPLLRRCCLIQYFVARPALPVPVRRYSVAVVLPVRGSAAALPWLLERMPTLGSRTEIIVAVADGDLQRSADVDAAVGPLSGRRAVRVAKFSPADGWWSAALVSDAELLMVLPVDGDFDPVVTEKFYRVIAESNADFVVGSRLVYPSAMPAWRWLHHRFLSALCSFTIGQPLTDAACGAFALRREDAVRLPLSTRTPSHDGGAMPFAAAAAQHGLKIAEVPVHFRSGGSADRCARQWAMLGREIRRFAW
ncbi:MAG: glycosyl transferase family 2 [Parcubacteria group bacterium Gr01-1014_31]|nr:MAG: glycosyl transferase family 2 [Parcubacteria group bacterium Gr01-1014_31]